MKAFAALYRDRDASTVSTASTPRSAEQSALQACLRAARPENPAWAVYCLAGGQPCELVLTFVAWNGALDDLARQPVNFAEACSGLADAEMRQVDAIIRKTTVQSSGPVRSVTPTLVFEPGFERIARSPRHTSAVALRFQRVLRWRQDKPAAEADALSSLPAWLS